MNHEDIKILVSAYSDGEVSPSEKNIVEEHLKTCASCQRDLKGYKAMSSSLSQWPNESLSPDEQIKVQRSIELRREPMFTKRSTMMTVGTTLALVVVVVSISLRTFTNSRIQGRLKTSADDIGDQYSEGTTRTLQSKMSAAASSYEPYNLNSSYNVAAGSYAQEPEQTYSTDNSTLLNTQQEYWATGQTNNNLPAARQPMPVTRQMQLAPNITNPTLFEPGIRASMNENKRLGAGLVGADAALMRTRVGVQMATFNAAYQNMPNAQVLAGMGNVDPNVGTTVGLRRAWNSGNDSYNSWNAPQPYPYEQGYPIQYAPSNTEQYDRIYENPFLTAKDNPLSTFSISVDTGSYSNIRRFLFNGQMPSKDAVQTEELINYFSYDYPQPAGNDPFSITTEVSTCPWNPQHQLALIGLQGKKIPLENLPPSNLVFLVDVSGSMGVENKLPLVKQSLHLLVEQLRPEDTVSIAVFAGGADRILEPTSGRDKDKILNAIDNLEAGGSTNGEEGLQLAYKMAQENFIPNGNNRIIVTTDGDFNVGTSADGDLVRMIEQKRDQGVYLTVFGFGMGNIKASRMEKLADAGHGNYDYIDSLDEARKQLEQQLGGTLYAIAKDVKIQVEFNPSTVEAYRLIGYEEHLLNKEDFNNDNKQAGVIGSGHTVTALYEITPAGSNEPAGDVDPLRYQTSTVNLSNDLMTIKLRYKDPQSDTSKLIVGTLNRWQVNPQPSENLRFAGAVAEFGMLLRDSAYKENASYQQVLDTAQNAIGSDYNGYRKDFLDLVEKASSMDQAIEQHERRKYFNRGE